MRYCIEDGVDRYCPEPSYITITSIENPILTKDEVYVIGDSHGQYQPGPSSIMIMSTEYPISTQGEGYAIDYGDDQYQPRPFSVSCNSDLGSSWSISTWIILNHDYID